MAIDEELLSILVCPVCKGGVRLSGDKSGIVCGRCRLVFPIKDGIPVMIMEEAKGLGK
ncbi:MAG: Trm112 family protein [Deltaproteobacteria bacterium]|nr:Trm112 family protein [Deltaproteobacteria bacterium]